MLNYILYPVSKYDPCLLTHPFSFKEILKDRGKKKKLVLKFFAIIENLLAAKESTTKEKQSIFFNRPTKWNSLTLLAGTIMSSSICFSALRASFYLLVSGLYHLSTHNMTLLSLCLSIPPSGRVVSMSLQLSAPSATTLLLLLPVHLTFLSLYSSRCGRKNMPQRAPAAMASLTEFAFPWG